MNYKFIATLFVLLFAITVAAQSDSKERRQFDFWIGEWDVNLRVQQNDKSWKDQHKAIARVYPVLGGKAILELWSEKEGGINGYSLRYFNSNSGEWDLWLNWVGKNRSGTNRFTGLFRHGRGEFFQERPIDENTRQISRYTFSDITPDSLRWDDGYSRDGGRNWASNWIMEFSRRAANAPAIGDEKNLHTYFKGATCDQAEFDIIKKLSGNQEKDKTIKLYNVLDGCMIMGFAESGESSVFFTLTYNTYADVYELTFLDDEDSSFMAVYYGPKTESAFNLKKLKKGDDELSTAVIEFDDDIITSIKLNYRGKPYSIVQQ